MSKKVFLPHAEIKFTFIRSPGPGGQNVNKVATTALLRFNVMHSEMLPDAIRQRLLFIIGNRLTNEGDFLIKASRFRTQEKNKQDALDRLSELLQEAAVIPKSRKKTKPTYASTQKRLSGKKMHGKNKALRSKCDTD